MLTKTRGIVVRNVNFKDNSVICHIYTEDFGSQQFMLHGVRNQKGNVRPLSHHATQFGGFGFLQKRKCRNPTDKRA